MNIVSMNARKERERMELDVVKEWLEEGGEGGGRGEREEELAAIEGWEESTTVKFFDAFTMKGVATDLIEPGRLLCSFQVPPRLTNLSGNYLHSGAVASLVDLVGSAVFFTTGAATSGVSVDITVSYLEAIYVHEEIEIDAKVLHMGEKVGVAMVELREKKTGKIKAQGRHAKYLAASSKL